MIRRLKIIESNNQIDGLMLFAYINLLASFIGVFALPFAFLSPMSLAAFCLITYRDEVLRVKEKPIDILTEEIKHLKTEVSSIRIHQGLNR